MYGYGPSLIDGSTGAQDERAAAQGRDFREQALAQALEDYLMAADRNLDREASALGQILDLPEIVHQAAFAPDLSGEGQLAGLAATMTREQRIQASCRAAFGQLVSHIRIHGAADAYDSILRYLVAALDLDEVSAPYFA
jgi:hypothetical protein